MNCSSEHLTQHVVLYTAASLTLHMYLVMFLSGPPPGVPGAAPGPRAGQAAADGEDLAVPLGQDGVLSLTRPGDVRAPSQALLTRR